MKFHVISILNIFIVIVAHSQQSKVRDKLDSIKHEYSIGRDSLWFIRYDGLAEKFENAIIIAFKDSSICVHNFPIVNDHIKTSQVFSSCLKQHLKQGTELIKGYGASFNGKIGAINSRHRIEFTKGNKVSEFREMIPLDDAFIDNLMQMALSDDPEESTVKQSHLEKGVSKNKKSKLRQPRNK